MSGVNQWPQADIAKLRALRSEGVSTDEIARRLRTTRGAVVGKAFRLKLEPKANPSMSKNQERDAEIIRRRQLGETFAGLAIAFRLDASRIRQIVGEQYREPPKRMASVPLVRLVSVPPPRTCQWPIGDPKEPGFHFCGAASAPTRPYCPAHREVAYVRVRDRREEAA